MIASSLSAYIQPGKRVHLIGIGGASMTPLAKALKDAGLVVTGSDMTQSVSTDYLQEAGIPVFIGHEPKNIDGAEFIVRTAAAREENLEIQAARANGTPVFERAEAWGHIMRQYKHAVCIAGTHGKTTTTSMAAHILLAAGSDPTIMIGGTLPKLQTGHRVGRGDTIVLESCEYYNSFHNFAPTVAVVLNVEEDHLDYFNDLDEIKTSFGTFAGLTPPDGTIVANGDDENTMSALSGLGRPLLTFGLDAANRVHAENIVRCGTRTMFDIMVDGAHYTNVTLCLPGDYNIKNALAAASVAFALDLPPDAVREGLSDFIGVDRRFTYKGKRDGVDIYDDYAHHPTELHVLFDAVEALDYKRILVAFQPHTYTRTYALFDDFAAALSRPDLMFVAEIFAAREKNTVGITAKDLAAKIPNAQHFENLESLADALHEQMRSGDLLITVGAGDIYKVGEILLG